MITSEGVGGMNQMCQYKTQDSAELNQFRSKRKREREGERESKVNRNGENVGVGGNLVEYI